MIHTGNWTPPEHTISGEPIAMLIIEGKALADVFIEHPLLKKESIEHREFQVNIAGESAKEPTLVVLPTGLGKTVVALLVIADILRDRKGKVLFLAPTKPLVDQHAEFLSQNLQIGDITLFTGEVSPEKRAEMWKESRVIVSTPQVISNDLENSRGSLKDVALIVFDEAHRAVGDYSYVDIADRYHSEVDNPLILGMTASPGSDIDKIAEVCKNLGITNIAIRSELDEDVAPYVYGIAIDRAYVDVPEEMERIIDLLQEILDEKIKALKKYKLLDERRRPNTRDLLEVGNVLRARLNSGRKNFHLFRGLSIQAGAIKINHGIDLAKSQGSDSLRKYISRIVEDSQTKGGSRASKELVKDSRFEMVRRLLDQSDAENPKLDKVNQIVRDQLSSKPDSLIIVFTHYRDTCERVTRLLEELPEAHPVRFVGQAKHGEDNGLRQREQRQIVDDFKAGKYNVLVATSVAEEGLDIPSTELVVFYEPIPSEIRTIQRRGRTGRKRPGRVVVLLARDTKDEIYHYSSRRKERSMRSKLEGLRRRLKIARKISSDTGDSIDVDSFFDSSSEGAAAERKARAISESQTLLTDFGALSSSGLRLLANHERNPGMVKKLEKIGIQFEQRKLKPEDFVIGNDLVVLRESVDSFLKDIDRDDLEAQISDLKTRYRRPMLVVEGAGAGGKDIATKLPLFDVLNSLIARLHLPVIPTKDEADTAAFIASLVKAEIGRDKSAAADRTIDISEYQRRMVQGLPNVTSFLAERLLERFGSVQNVMAASKEELMAVEGVGNAIAEEILRVAKEKYTRH